MLRKWIVPIMFIAGLVIFFYPIIGNWLSTKAHYTVISEHNEALEKMTAAEKDIERKNAKKYNESLNDTAIPITDPFTEDPADGATAIGYFNMLDIGESMGSLEIPSIRVNLPIYHGAGEDVLQQGVGHMSNSSLPIGGQGTHAALTAHRGLPSSKLFRNLDKLHNGDTFYIHTLDEILAYRVDDVKVVLPTETNWLEMQENKDYVTLITCEPYMINTHRLLVRGERIPYEEAVIASAPVKKEEKSKLLLFIGGIMGIIGLLIVYYVKKGSKTGDQA